MSLYVLDPRYRSESDEPNSVHGGVVTPLAFDDFFVATAGASGALVGLLFVAITVSAGRVLGPNPDVASQVRASTALTALATPLIIALVGLIPGASVAITAMVTGTGGLIYALVNFRRLISATMSGGARFWALTLMGGFVLVLAVELGWGIRLLIVPSDLSAYGAVSGAMVGSLILGINRAWGLVDAGSTRVLGTVSDLLFDSAKMRSRTGEPEKPSDGSAAASSTVD